MSGPEITGATYGVELLFDGDYDLASPELHAQLRARCPGADVQTGRGPIVLFHRDAPIPLKDSLICAQTAILGTDSAVAPAQLEPARFLEAMDSPDPSDRLFLALNVRMFNVESGPGESVMDTMGLASLGLPDLQVHSTGLEPDDVARHLFNTAYYVLEKGDVIADGQTIDGIPRGTKWRCQHEASLVGPSRVVLDIDPGPPFAAGHRKSRGAAS